MTEEGSFIGYCHKKYKNRNQRTALCDLMILSRKSQGTKALALFCMWGSI